jgi:hypothetical protein
MSLSRRDFCKSAVLIVGGVSLTNVVDLSEDWPKADLEPQSSTCTYMCTCIMCADDPDKRVDFSRLCRESSSEPKATPP